MLVSTNVSGLVPHPDGEIKLPSGNWTMGIVEDNQRVPPQWSVIMRPPTDEVCRKHLANGNLVAPPYGRNLVAIWTVLAGFAGRRVILALLSLRLWRRCLARGSRAKGDDTRTHTDEPFTRPDSCYQARPLHRRESRGRAPPW